MTFKCWVSEFVEGFLFLYSNLTAVAEGEKKKVKYWHCVRNVNCGLF